MNGNLSDNDYIFHQDLPSYVFPVLLVYHICIPQDNVFLHRYNHSRLNAKSL